MNNPLPVDPFSVAEAARRTWPVLIEAMLEAVCLVEPEGLRIVAANGAAGRLLGLSPSELVGRDMLATAPTPEDESFWQSVADQGGCASILSDSFVTRAGQSVPVVRRVSKIEPAPGNALYVVALYDRSEQLRIEEAAAVSTAELAATLESVGDGVLVVDLAGHISNFNRRFAALWELPDEMLMLHADDEIFDWMRQRVADARVYMRRLAEIDAETMLRATDTLTLRSGAVVERVTLPQLSRGRPIGR
ncbi:MAG TPA: PAS domain-containing protein, partial [Caldimonas sp.]